MLQRIAVWTLLGAIVAGAWALLSFNHAWFNALLPVGIITMPVGLLGRSTHLAMTYRQAILYNALSYALIGLIVELLRQAYRSSRLRLHKG